MRFTFFAIRPKRFEPDDTNASSGEPQLASHRKVEWQQQRRRASARNKEPKAAAGKPLLQRNILRDGLNPILKKLNLKQDGKAFHSFRRFRVMHLRKNRVPWDLEKFWIGHANKDVTDKYAAQLKEDVDWRKDVAEKTGLGFALPVSIETSIGQLGQPEVVRSEEAKAA